MQEYAEGGLNTHTWRLPGRSKQGNVTFKRGIVNKVLWDWYRRHRQRRVQVAQLHHPRARPVGQRRPARVPAGRRVSREVDRARAVGARQNNLAVETLEAGPPGPAAEEVSAMPVHIEKMTSDVVDAGRSLSLTPAQVEKLVALVISQARGARARGASARAPRPRSRRQASQAARGGGLRCRCRPSSRSTRRTAGRTCRRSSRCSSTRRSTRIAKGAQIAEIAIPGIDAPILQFVRGQTQTLALELFFDTTRVGSSRTTACATCAR